MTGPARARVSRAIPAPPALLHRILADYREHHPRILPRPEFERLEVEEGGVGAGTRIRVHMRVLGAKRAIRMRVDEPEPGRLLRETDLDTGDETTFALDPDAGGSTRVTIETTWAEKRGLRGWIERQVNPRVARRLYERELEALEAYARQLAAAAPGAPTASAARSG